MVAWLAAGTLQTWVGLTLGSYNISWRTAGQTLNSLQFANLRQLDINTNQSGATFELIMN